MILFMSKISTPQLIILGIALIVGSGYWFFATDTGEKSDLEWFVEDENRLNREINNPEARQSEIQPSVAINTKCEVKKSQSVKPKSGGGAPPPPVEVPPNSSNVVALVKNCAVWPAGSIPSTDYDSYSSIVVYSLTVEIRSSSEVKDGLDVLARTGAIYEVFSKEPLSFDLIGKDINAFLELKGSTLGVRWWISDISIPKILIDTSTWKTYRNEKYGYEIRYPDGSILSIDDLSLGAAGHHVVQEFPPSFAYINIQVGDTFLAICNNCGGFGLGKDNIKKEESILINGKTYTAEGFYSNTKDNTSKIMWINFSGLEVRYGYASSYGEQLNANQIEKLDIFNKKILSTFKFIEPRVDIADWQTYRDEKYGFLVKYPQDWKAMDITGLTFASNEILSIGFGQKVNDLPVSVRITKENQYFPLLGPSFQKEKEENVNIDGKEATKFTMVNKYTKEVCIQIIMAENIFKYGFSACPNVADFNQILSTFKFLK